jgi:predicted MFS family arabinose efflux permease
MRSAWIVVACGALIVTLSMGIRQSFGIYLPGISADLGVGREAFSLSLAMQNVIWGVAGPFAGMLADRYGSGRVAVAGAALYAGGLLLGSTATEPGLLHLSVGAMIGIAQSCTTFATIFGAVGRAVPPEARSTAFGIVGAGGSFGQFAVAPLAQVLYDAVGWSGAFVALALPAAAMGVLAVGIAGRAPAPAPGAAPEQPLGDALREAFGHSGYWLLTLGFFVCGFQVAFIGTHLPAYLRDGGLAPQIGAWALALIGLFNIAGSFLFGKWGGTGRKKRLLAWIYLARSAVILPFMLLPLSPATALVFAAAIGFLWLGTVPLTSGLVGQIFGVRYLSTLYGVVFLSHQVGSFLGVWLGGLAYDALGSYDAVWWAGIALGLVAAALHWPIDDRPVERMRSASAGAAA